MKKSPSRRSRTGKATKAAITATVLTVPMLSVPASGLARTPEPRESSATSRIWSGAQGVFLKFADVCLKLHETYSIVGLDDGHTIYKNARGGYFYLDPATGDMKVVSADVYLKFKEATRTTGQHLKMIKLDAHKLGGAVTLVGVDAQGHVVQKNSKGETFYLNPDTGDMVFVK